MDDQGHAQYRTKRGRERANERERERDCSFSVSLYSGLRENKGTILPIVTRVACMHRVRAPVHQIPTISIDHVTFQQIVSAEATKIGAR